MKLKRTKFAKFRNRTVVPTRHVLIKNQKTIAQQNIFLRPEKTYSNTFIG